MNTLTISIGLLVLATLVAVALHSAWQSYRGYQERKALEQSRAPDSAISAASIAAADEVAGSAAGRLRSEPSLDDGPYAEHFADLPPADLARFGEAATASDRPEHGEHGAVASPRAAPEPSAAMSRAKLDDPRAPGSDVATAAGPAAAPIASVASVASVASTGSTASAASPATGAAGKARATETAAPSTADEPRLNPLVDCIVEFALGSPMPGQRLLYATQSIRRFGSKPALFDGQVANEVRHADDAAGAAASSPSGLGAAPVLELTAPGATALNGGDQPQWQAIKSAHLYRSFRMGVLLANRHGALNALEFAEFADVANRLAEHLGALVVIPDMNQALESARRLDADCIKLDAQLGLNIDCANALSTADLNRIAREQGLIERGSNRFARLGANDELLFSLALADRPNRITMLLDVPRAPVEQQPWAALLQCAHETMISSQGHLVDDAGRPLVSRNLEMLSAELAQRYAMLDQSGFKAGSAIALRVFN